MKKIIVTLLLAALVLAAVPALAQNAFTAANGGIVPTIQFVTYEGFGFVEVDFLQDVNYENPTVSVTDAAGAPVTAAIVQLDDDDLTFQITDFAADAAYDSHHLRRARGPQRQLHLRLRQLHRAARGRRGDQEGRL